MKSVVPVWHFKSSESSIKLGRQTRHKIQLKTQSLKFVYYSPTFVQVMDQKSQCYFLFCRLLNSSSFFVNCEGNQTVCCCCLICGKNCYKVYRKSSWNIALPFELTCMLLQSKFQKHSLNFTEINTLISDKSICMQRPGFYYYFFL